MSETPLYSIPYLTPSTRARDMPVVSQGQSERIEALLRDRNVEPLDSDKADIVARINALEADSLEPKSGLQPLNGFTLSPGSQFFVLGDLVFIVANLNRAAGVASVDCASIPTEFAPPASVTFQGVASQGGSAISTTIVLGTTGTFRNWTSSPTNRLLSFNLFWKRGA